MSNLTITQRKSSNGCDKRQLDTLRSIGLRRINHSVTREDSPQLRGMIHKVRHIVSVESSGDDSSASSPGGELAGGRQ